MEAKVTRGGHDTIRAMVWTTEGLRLIDQRALPAAEQWLLLTNPAAVAQAIREMVVRGAPAIGITAAYGVVLSAREHFARTPAQWRQSMEDDMRMLAAARPTAVNLVWALQRMRECAHRIAGGVDPVPALLEEASAIHAADVAANRAMGRLGAAFIPPGCSVLTHCNTGSLATGGYGTALGVIRRAWHDGLLRHVYADETRPWLQGSRLTAWELLRDDIPVTLIAEGAAAYLMKLGRVQWVVVGADRVAANGDVANKIGTYSLAVTARRHGVRFMVVAPSSTLDMQAPDGEAIPIENRPETEVLTLSGQAVAASGARAWNPAFDITPAELIDVIVTERGVVEAPDSARMAALNG
jgi:methylthioribose-1-phosphate isomerase